MAEDEKQPQVETEAQSIPIVRVEGEGYVTRKDGTVVPFTFSNEA